MIFHVYGTGCQCSEVPSPYRNDAAHAANLHRPSRIRSAIDDPVRRPNLACICVRSCPSWVPKSRQQQESDRPDFDCQIVCITYNIVHMSFAVEIYVARNGNRPFADWFNALRDIKTQARIEASLRRLGLAESFR